LPKYKDRQTKIGAAMIQNNNPWEEQMNKLGVRITQKPMNKEFKSF
jgi:hypothetical protein